MPPKSLKSDVQTHAPSKPEPSPVKSDVLNGSMQHLLKVFSLESMM
jgi:hypothetical protein